MPAPLSKALGGTGTTDGLAAQLALKADKTGFAAVATSGSASDLGTGTLPAARLPAAAAAALGGVRALAVSATKFLTSIGTDGVPVAAQPVISDVSGLQTALDAKASTTALADKADKTALADKASVSTTNTFGAIQTISYTYPGLQFNYSGVLTATLAVNGTGALEWAKSDGTKLVYITNTGRIWSAEWNSFVHDRIEARAQAYAALRQAQLNNVPIAGGRWMYAGDYSANQIAANYPGGGEPFPGAVSSGFAASGGYFTVARYRVFQMLNDNGQYITIGYGN